MATAHCSLKAGVDNMPHGIEVTNPNDVTCFIALANLDTLRTPASAGGGVHKMPKTRVE
jgi:hypothetical protein